MLSICYLELHVHRQVPNKYSQALLLQMFEFWAHFLSLLKEYRFRSYYFKKGFLITPGNYMNKIIKYPYGFVLCGGSFFFLDMRKAGIGFNPVMISISQITITNKRKQTIHN